MIVSTEVIEFGNKTCTSEPGRICPHANAIGVTWREEPVWFCSYFREEVKKTDVGLERCAACLKRWPPDEEPYYAEEVKKLRQKVKDQQERLRFLEGATNHAGGFDNFAKLMLENPVDVKPLVMFLMPQLREEVEGLGLALGGGPVLDRTARVANVAKMIAEVVGLRGDENT